MNTETILHDCGQALGRLAHVVLAGTDQLTPIVAGAAVLALVGVAMIWRVALERFWYGEPVGGRGLAGSLLVCLAGCITRLAIT